MALGQKPNAEFFENTRTTQFPNQKLTESVVF